MRRLQGDETDAQGAATAAGSADGPSDPPPPDSAALLLRELHPLEFLGRVAAQWRDGYARRGDAEQEAFWRVQHQVLSQLLERNTVDGRGGGDGDGGAGAGAGAGGVVGKVVPTNMGGKQPPYTIDGDIYDI